MKIKRGFTLVEVLAVIAIIGFLALLVLPNFIGSFNKAKQRAMITQENEVVDAAKNFLEDFCRHPLDKNKGKCNYYSIATTNSDIKYTCLSTIQNESYIDTIISQGEKCTGFIVYGKEYSGYKSYLKCGNAYMTKGMDTFIAENGESLLEICENDTGVIIPDDPDTPTPGPTNTKYYANTVTGKEYVTLNEAFLDADSNEGIIVLANATEKSSAILSGSKENITLDLNGKTISMGANSIVNNSSLDINNNNESQASIIGTGNVLINNNILNIYATSGSNSVSIINNSALYQNVAITNNTGAHLSLNENVSITSKKATTNCSGDDLAATSVVKNYGDMLISGASIENEGTTTCDHTIINGSNLTMESGYVSAAGSSTLWQTADSIGRVNISGGSIKSQTSFAVNAAGGATINISDDANIVGNQCGINLSSKNTGIVNVSGGSITGTSNGITLNSRNTGALNVTGGVIIGNSSNGISLRGSGIVTLGVKDSNVSTTTPTIESHSTSANYGIYIESGSTFNFYDGIIKSHAGTGHAINGVVADTPDGYNVKKTTENGIETAILDRETKYRVTFYYNSNKTSGGLTVSTKTVDCSTFTDSCIVSIPSEVTSSVGKYNSTYRGVSDSLGNMNSSSLTINGNKTYYANYSSSVLIYYYNSSYTSKTYYRNEYFTSTTNMDSKISANQTTTSNYSTAGGPGNSVWTGLSTGKDATTEYTSVQAAANSNSTTLYTVYKLNIKFEKGANVSAIGSTSSSCNITSTDTSCIIVLPTITVNTGYTTEGWNNSYGQSGGIAALGTYTLRENNKVLYANAKGNTYTVTFNCNGGSGAPSSQSATYGSPFTLTSSKCSTPKSGYEQEGWNTESNGSGADWTTTNTNNWTWNRTSNVTLYAKWKKTTYTVTFDCNGGSGAPSSQSATYGSSFTLTSATCTTPKSGNIQVGWNTASDGSGQNWTTANTENWTWNINNNVKLYAKWQTNSYTVSYNANGGSGAPSSQTYTYSDSALLTLSSTKPSRTKYNFLGWATSSNATVVQYDPGDQYSRSNTSNVTLYAVWENTKKCYRVTTSDGLKCRKTPATGDRVGGLYAWNYYWLYYQGDVVDDVEWYYFDKDETHGYDKTTAENCYVSGAYLEYYSTTSCPVDTNSSTPSSNSSSSSRKTFTCSEWSGWGRIGYSSSGQWTGNAGRVKCNSSKPSDTRYMKYRCSSSGNIWYLEENRCVK